MLERPNILFFLPDQHRPDWLGCNPDLPLRTPNLDRLAASGTTFTRAYTPSPVCSPARACLATGRSYAECGVVNNHDNTPTDSPTYYSRLRDAGFTHLLLAENVGDRGIQYDPTLSRLAEAQWESEAGESLVKLAEYRFPDVDGAIRRYRLMALR